MKNISFFPCLLNGKGATVYTKGVTAENIKGIVVCSLNFTKIKN